MRQFEDGTSGFTSGPRRTTWGSASLRVRLAGFALAVVAFAFLIIGIDSNIWRAQEHLEGGFAAIKAEKFYFGVNFRVRLRKLNDSLLDYHLASNRADLERFWQEARELKIWLLAKQAGFTGQGEGDAFKKLESAYGDYLARVDSQVQSNRSLPAGPEGFTASYAELRQDYRPVIQACDDVERAESGMFAVFLHESDHALRS